MTNFPDNNPFFLHNPTDTEEYKRNVRLMKEGAPVSEIFPKIESFPLRCYRSSKELKDQMENVEHLLTSSELDVLEYTYNLRLLNETYSKLIEQELKDEEYNGQEKI